MDNYMYRYRCEVKRIYHNCRSNNPRDICYRHISGLYSVALIDYKEWKTLMEYCNDYVNSQLTNK